MNKRFVVPYTPAKKNDHGVYRFATEQFGSNLCGPQAFACREQPTQTRRTWDEPQSRMQRNMWLSRRPPVGLPIGAPSPKLLSSPKLPPPVVTVRPLRPAAQNLSPRTKHLNEKLTRLKKSEGNESHCVKKPDETSSVPCRFFFRADVYGFLASFFTANP